MPRTVKCLDILSYLQASKFAGRHFMDPERRHKTPVLGTKGGLLPSAVIIIEYHHFFGTSSPSLVPTKQHNQGQMALAWVGLQKRNPQLEEPESFVIVFKQTCSLVCLKETLSVLYWTIADLPLCSRGKTLPLSSKPVHYTNILEKLVWDTSCQCFCLQDRKRCEPHLSTTKTKGTN